MATAEVWKSVLDWEGIYEVSSFGRVRSCDRLIRYASGRTALHRGTILKPMANQKGYLHVDLCRRNHAIRKGVHRLVLEAFVGSEYGKDACHNNGVRDDNRLENLRWDTRAGNINDCKMHGTTARGERAGASRLTRSQVERIKAELIAGTPQRTLAAAHGVSQTAIHYIAIGRNWAHV